MSHMDPTGEAAIRQMCFQVGTRLIMLGLILVMIGAALMGVHP